MFLCDHTATSMDIFHNHMKVNVAFRLYHDQITEFFEILKAGNSNSNAKPYYTKEIKCKDMPVSLNNFVLGLISINHIEYEW